MDGAVRLLSLLSVLVVFSSSASADVCLWSKSCSNRWVGSCGFGRVKVDQSDDCHGLCPPPRYSCHPFTTHMLCCNEETPIVSDECARCGNRVDVGNYWMCCSDGTEAKVTNHELRIGFCRSGAQLGIQPKSREVFKWRVFREWSECSALCGDGIRHRKVHCVGSLEYSPKQLYYVNDTKCDASHMPAKEESCLVRLCSHGEHKHDENKHDEHKHHRSRRHHRRHKRGLPMWAKILIFSSSAMATVGLVFGGYVFYEWWKTRNANHGFVYVALDNFS